MTDAPDRLPLPTQELVERALAREHAYRQTQKLWEDILASLRTVKIRWQDMPE